VTLRTGTVRADGTSTLAEHAGIVDTASGPAHELSPELDKKLAELMSRVKDQKETKAQFRIEVFLMGGPRKTVAVRGVVAVWTNGGYLHGGGDAAVYLCPQPVGDHACMAPIDMQFVTSRAASRAGEMEQVVVCTKCRRISRTDDLTGQMLYNATTQSWARILTQFFYLLSCSADISLSIERESLQSATQLERTGKPRGSAYARVTAKRECVTYPLANIIADTASGAGLEQRFRAFLEA
jgi:hypothetical protein